MPSKDDLSLGPDHTWITPRLASQLETGWVCIPTATVTDYNSPWLTVWGHMTAPATMAIMVTRWGSQESDSLVSRLGSRPMIFSPLVDQI